MCLQMEIIDLNLSGAVVCRHSEGGGFTLVRFPNPLFDVGWDSSTPIGGEFFFAVL